jgi:hypothetical protein
VASFNYVIMGPPPAAAAAEADPSISEASNTQVADPVVEENADVAETSVTSERGLGSAYHYTPTKEQTNISVEANITAVEEFNANNASAASQGALFDNSPVERMDTVIRILRILGLRHGAKKYISKITIRQNIHLRSFSSFRLRRSGQP